MLLAYLIWKRLSRSVKAFLYGRTVCLKIQMNFCSNHKYNFCKFRSKTLLIWCVLICILFCIRILHLKGLVYHWTLVYISVTCTILFIQAEQKFPPSQVPGVTAFLTTVELTATAIAIAVTCSRVKLQTRLLRLPDGRFYIVLISPATKYYTHFI